MTVVGNSGLWSVFDLDGTLTEVLCLNDSLSIIVLLLCEGLFGFGIRASGQSEALQSFPKSSGLGALLAAPRTILAVRAQLPDIEL